MTQRARAIRAEKPTRTAHQALLCPHKPQRARTRVGGHPGLVGAPGEPSSRGVRRHDRTPHTNQTDTPSYAHHAPPTPPPWPLCPCHPQSNTARRPGHQQHTKTPAASTNRLARRRAHSAHSYTAGTRVGVQERVREGPAAPEHGSLQGNFRSALLVNRTVQEVLNPSGSGLLNPRRHRGGAQLLNFRLAAAICRRRCQTNVRKASVGARRRVRAWSFLTRTVRRCNGGEKSPKC